MADEEDGADDVQEGGRSFFAANTRVVIAAAVAVALILVFVMPGTDQTVADGQDGQATGDFENYASGGEETGSTDVSGATDFTTVVIGENGVDPSRPKLQVGEAVQWENRMEFPVELSFDRIDQNLTIEPNGEGSIRFRGVTYYTVYNAETGGQFALGSVAVS